MSLTTLALIAALIFIAYRIRSKYRDDAYLIDIETTAYVRGLRRGREQGYADGWDTAYLKGVRDAESLREEGRL